MGEGLAWPLYRVCSFVTRPKRQLRRAASFLLTKGHDIDSPLRSTPHPWNWSVIKNELSFCGQYILSHEAPPPCLVYDKAMVRNSLTDDTKKWSRLTAFFFNIQSRSFTDFLLLFDLAFSLSLLRSNLTMLSSSSSPFKPCGTCCVPPPPPTRRHKKTFLAFFEFG